LTAEEIQSALDSGVNFHLSTKYWMEQMGLPFHPTHINPRDQDNARHSYAALLTYPKKYQMDWQLWNGGTARIFLWGDPDYARRFVETTHLYDGDSFEVDEPLATKMEGQFHDAKPFELLKPSARYYEYEFERSKFGDASATTPTRRRKSGIGNLKCVSARKPARFWKTRCIARAGFCRASSRRAIPTADFR
jgi:hypothetical protein